MAEQASNSVCLTTVRMVAAPVAEAVDEAGLVWVSDSDPGITRTRTAVGFDYLEPSGKRVADERTLARIRSLAIPPAYEQVWICQKHNGHLQATGKDARGRKQYRYHPKFREVRDEAKFGRMVEFGAALERIHERIDRDLSKRGLPREKVLALIVHLLETSLIRVGNEEYAKTNRSFGLTTLRNRHVRVEGQDVRFSFLGKSMVRHRITLHDRRLARLVSRLQDLEGQSLFQYLDEDGGIHSVTSGDVNAYLKEISGGDFTAKDFRTWAATVLALTDLAGAEPPATKKAGKAAVSGVLKVVAKQLGNTPAICRKCYVHPSVVSAYLDGSLRDFLARSDEREDSQSVSKVVECAEDAVIRLLKEYRAGTHKQAKSRPRRRAA